MKKLFALLLALAMILSLAACKKEPVQETEPTKAPTEAPVNTTDTTTPVPTESTVPDPTDAPVEVDIFAKGEGVMTYAEYMAADIDAPVVIEAFVQDHQSWWDNTITVYAADPDGAYFIYGMTCSQEDAAKLVPGTKIKVTGYKAEWSGEIEISDATFEFEEGSYIAEPIDLTSIFANENNEGLLPYQNAKFKVSGLSVSGYEDSDAAFLYNWDGSGSHDSNSDLYFRVYTDNYCTAELTVESYLCDNTTDVYATVEGLLPGDVINVEGYLYWYNGVNPHITSVEVVSHEKSEGTMTHAEYMAAELDSPVVIETYIIEKQSWWDNKATLYTADRDGGYFIYNAECSEELYDNLPLGTKIRVTGYKSEWSGEVEIVDATLEALPGHYTTQNKTSYLEVLANGETLLDHQNEVMYFPSFRVVAQEDGKAFWYSYDNSGSHDANSDIYFNAVSSEGEVITFVVESYLYDNNSLVYQSVESLNVDDEIELHAFVYWYNGPQPHVMFVSKL